MKIAQMMALAMLLGSIPFGHIVLYFRARGSLKDAGFSMDLLRRKLGMGGLALVLVLTAAKGFVPVYLAKGSLDSVYMITLIGLIAILSHSFPYWLMFRRTGGWFIVGAGALIGFHPAWGICVTIAGVVSGLIFKRKSDS